MSKIGAGAGIHQTRARAPRGPVSDEIRRKDKKEKGYGEVYAGDVSHPVIHLLRPKAFKLLMTLRANSFRRQNYTVDASYSELASKTNMHERTVQRSAEQLIALGLVVYENAWGKYAHWRGPGWQRGRWRLLRPPETLSHEELERLVVLPRKGLHADDALPSSMFLTAAERARQRREQLRIEAEAAAESSCRNLRPVLERTAAELLRLEQVVLGWPDLPAPFGPLRRSSPGAVSEAWTARGRVRAARGGIWDAWTRIGEVVAVLDADELPSGLTWAAVYDAMRLCVELRSALDGVVRSADEAVQLARRGWLALLGLDEGLEPDAGDEGLEDEDEDEDEDPVDEEPPPRIGEPWRPPASWEPVEVARTAAGWEQQADDYRQASLSGGRLGEKMRRYILAQGWRPDWPEPGLSALLGATGGRGRGPPDRRR